MILYDDYPEYDDPMEIEAERERIEQEREMNEIPRLVGSYLHDLRTKSPDHGPCDCPISLDTEVGAHHTLAQHIRDSCGGVGMPEPCGGCYDCMCAQIEHWRRQEARGRV